MFLISVPIFGKDPESVFFSASVVHIGTQNPQLAVTDSESLHPHYDELIVSLEQISTLIDIMKIIYYFLRVYYLQKLVNALLVVRIRSYLK